MVNNDVTRCEKRDLRFEILRIVAMLIIIASHAAWHLSWMLHLYSGLDTNDNWTIASYYTVAQMGQIGVAIFFMITGYFMHNKEFALQRVLKTVAHVFLYSIILLLLVIALMCTVGLPAYMQAMFNAKNLAMTLMQSLLPILTNTFWFMTAYVVLLLMTPFINKLLGNMPKHVLEYGIAILILLAIMMIYGNFAGLFGSIEYAMLCYLLGVWAKAYSDQCKKWFTLRMAVLYAILGFVIMTAFNFLSLSGTSLGNVLNWFDLMQSGGGLRIISIFIAFASVASCHLNISPKIFCSSRIAPRVILMLSSATFGVYMLHDHPLVRQFIWSTMSSIGLPTLGFVKILSLIIIVVVVYAITTIIAVLLDRFIVKPLTKVIVSNRQTRKIVDEINARAQWQ